jgi:hypothetical protein
VVVIALTGIDRSRGSKAFFRASVIAALHSPPTKSAILKVQRRYPFAESSEERAPFELITRTGFSHVKAGWEKRLARTVRFALGEPRQRARPWQGDAPDDERPVGAGGRRRMLRPLQDGLGGPLERLDVVFGNRPLNFRR